jgi:GAF domain
LIAYCVPHFLTAFLGRAFTATGSGRRITNAENCEPTRQTAAISCIASASSFPPPLDNYNLLRLVKGISVESCETWFRCKGRRRMLEVAQAAIGFPVPPNERERVEEVRFYDPKDSCLETGLNEICLEAQSLFHVPMALITLVGSERQKILAGAEAKDSVGRDAFGSYVILNDEPLIVPDATCDERFRDNPFVIGDIRIRFYAGAPLLMRPEIRIGALCLIDVQPRMFAETDARRLGTLAGLAVAEIRSGRIRNELKKFRDRLGKFEDGGTG